MRFWSEGLGDRELVMRLGNAKVERKDDIILLSGIVDSPAPWEFEVKIGRADWEKILQTAVSKEACGFIGRHATLGLALALAGAIVKFVFRLSVYRIQRIFRGAGRPGIPAEAAGAQREAGGSERKAPSGDAVGR